MDRGPIPPGKDRRFSFAGLPTIVGVQIALSERVSHRLGHIGFGQDQLCAIFGDAGFHFLLFSNGFGSALFGLGPGNAGIGFRLVGLQASPDVFANIDVFGA